jgi:hypothetical protein
MLWVSPQLHCPLRRDGVLGPPLVMVLVALLPSLLTHHLLAPPFGPYDLLHLASSWVV